MARTLSLAEAADELGYSRSALARHRRGDRIVFDDGQELRLIRLGRVMRVPEAELARFLGESDVSGRSAGGRTSESAARSGDGGKGPLDARPDQTQIADGGSVRSRRSA